MSARTKGRSAVATKAKQALAYNHLGQKMGSKGQRTRQLLIDTTVALLETQGLRDLSVVEVARVAQTSPATFYVYFRGVPEVVLAALESAPQTSPEIEAMIGQDWLAPGPGGRALAFVVAYTELWNQYRTIFRVRNLAAEEGDERFYRARMTAARPLMSALSAQIAKAQAAGRTPADLSPQACAGTVLMMLERLAAIGPITVETDGINYATLREAAAYTIGFMLGARD